MSLIENIHDKTAVPCVIGLGYVGLPLLVEFAAAGFNAVGIDVDKDKVDMLNRGKSYIDDISCQKLSQLVRTSMPDIPGVSNIPTHPYVQTATALQGSLFVTTDYSILREVDTINICVPTPLRKTKDPDISYIIAATEEILKYLKSGQLIILESTTYPGTTEEVVLPMLESAGLKVGRDFYLAFSPERVDPGNKQFNTGNIPKVVGGVTQECTKVASALYQEIIQRVISVSSTRVAEMAKLLENTFRAVNIGLINEIAQMCNKIGIDVWEVIETAKTKPFGFMPFYPGPGLGGHCIPLDPLYLSWKAKLNGFNPRFIELADEINSSMPEFVISKIADALNEGQKSLNGSRILILGVAYKRDVSDIRESPALDIIRLLNKKRGSVLYNDPYIPHLNIDGSELTSVNLSDELLQSVDCAVIVTDHSNYNYRKIVANTKLVIDTRNATKGLSPQGTVPKRNIVKI